MLTATNNRRAVRMIGLVTTDKGAMHEMTFGLDNPMSNWTMDKLPDGWTVEIIRIEWE